MEIGILRERITTKDGACMLVAGSGLGPDGRIEDNGDTFLHGNLRGRQEYYGGGGIANAASWVRVPLSTRLGYQDARDRELFHPLPAIPDGKECKRFCSNHSAKDGRLLIFDLDETLIHTSTEDLPGLSTIARIGDMRIYARPHLYFFLSSLEPLYNLGVWSASSADYASVVLSAIFSNVEALALAWSRERCGLSYAPEAGEHRLVKDLRKVKRKGYELAKTLIIDDIPGNLRKNYGNHIRIPPFTGCTEDRALLNLARILSDKSILTHNDFRDVDKRHWAYTEHI